MTEARFVRGDDRNDRPHYHEDRLAPATIGVAPRNIMRRFAGTPQGIPGTAARRGRASTSPAERRRRLQPARLRSPLNKIIPRQFN